MPNYQCFDMKCTSGKWTGVSDHGEMEWLEVKVPSSIHFYKVQKTEQPAYSCVSSPASPCGSGCPSQESLLFISQLDDIIQVQLHDGMHCLSENFTFCEDPLLPKACSQWCTLCASFHVVKATLLSAGTTYCVWVSLQNIMGVNFFTKWTCLSWNGFAIRHLWKGTPSPPQTVSKVAEWTRKWALSFPRHHQIWCHHLRCASFSNIWCVFFMYFDFTLCQRTL